MLFRSLIIYTLFFYRYIYIFDVVSLNCCLFIYLFVYTVCLIPAVSILLIYTFYILIYYFL